MRYAAVIGSVTISWKKKFIKLYVWFYCIISIWSTPQYGGVLYHLEEGCYHAIFLNIIIHFGLLKASWVDCTLVLCRNIHGSIAYIYYLQYWCMTMYIYTRLINFPLHAFTPTLYLHKQTRMITVWHASLHTFHLIYINWWSQRKIR